jgi:hypothetical protein
MMNLLFWRNTRPINPALNGQAGKPHNLANIPAGKQVTIRGFGGLSPATRQHLQAYGLLPGRTVRVLAQRPVTIILIEQTELAFEQAIARQVFADADE